MSLSPTNPNEPEELPDDYDADSGSKDLASIGCFIVGLAFVFVGGIGYILLRIAGIL